MIGSRFKIAAALLAAASSSYEMGIILEAP